MFLRLALFIVLAIFVARAFWRLVDGIVEGINGGPARGRTPVPTRGVQMVRDPVCGTFVLPDHALTLTHGGTHLFFCSAACRDRYRAGGSGRPGDSAGRARTA